MKECQHHMCKGKPLFTKACAYGNCGKPFQTSCQMQDYCKGRCRQNAKYMRKRGRLNRRRPFATYTEEAKEDLRTRARNWRQAAINALGGRCIRCNYEEHQAALQIDHINGGGRDDPRGQGQKLYRRIVAGNNEGLQLLCANCHAIKTAEEREYWPTPRRPVFRLPPITAA